MKQITETEFENIIVREFKLPVGLWPVNLRLKKIGCFQLVIMLKDIYELIIAF